MSGTFPARENRGNAVVVPLPWEISGDDLRTWAFRTEAPARLPLLVRRLLASTVPLQSLDMRGDGGVQLPGWDGVVRATQGNAWCPAGLSYWELTVQTDDAKLNEDFEKRSANAPKSAKSATYVAVIAGRYNPKKGKEGWSAARRAQGPWADVRLLDADDLAAWLEQSPAASLWMAYELGRPVVGVTLPEEALRLWSAATEPPLPPDVLLLGDSRAGLAEALRERLVDPRGVGWVGIEGVSEDEARAFALAAIVTDPNFERRERTLSRTVVVGPNAWDWLVRSSSPQSPLVLVPDFADADVKSAQARAFVVARAHSTEGPNTRLTMEDYVPFDRLRARLVDLGMRESDAHTCVTRAAGRISDLRRQLGEGALPAWAQRSPAALWIPLLLIERWRPRNEADRRVVEQLGASPIELDRLCEEFSVQEDRPVRRAEEWDLGVTWEWCAADTTWMLLAGRVPGSDLERFQVVAVAVFETVDPKFEVPVAERFAAGASDRQNRPSEVLREGVARTLARLGNGVSGHPEHTASKAGARIAVAVVREVLVPSWKRWAALSAELPWLAEAAPGAFFEALHRSLAREDGCARLLAEEDRWSSPHTGLLWALERLAWHPRWMPQSADALATLAARDPGGRVSNRPLASLGAIVRAVAPQTTAPLEDRLAAVDRVLSRHFSVGWKLLLSILSSAQGGVVWESNRPQYLPIGGLPDRPGSLLEAPARATFRAAVERAILHAGVDASRWIDLVARKGRWHDDIESLLLDAFERCEPQIVEGREALWESLRAPAAVATLREDEAVRARLEGLRERLAPTDIVARHAWLFGGVRSGTFSKDWGENERIAEQKRTLALHEIASSPTPWATLMRFAERVQHEGTLGRHLATSPLAEMVLARVREGGEELPLRRVQSAFLVKQIEERGDDWALDLLHALVRAERTDEVTEVVAWSGVSPRWWGLAERVDGAVADGYWKRARVWAFSEFTEDEREEAARKLLLHGREAAMLLALGSVEKISVSSATLLEALWCVARRPDAPETAAVLRTDSFVWSVEQALLAVDRAGDVPDAHLAALEIRLLGLVLATERSARALYRVLGESPEEFVGLVTTLYRAAGEPPLETVEESARLAAEASWRVLKEWRGFPGDTVPPGEERERRVEAWATEALRLCTEAGRGRVGRSEVGAVLARVPSQDGVWPCLAVRRLLERESDDDLADATLRAKRSFRGVHGRPLGEGGAQERQIAAAHREGAVKLRREWPRAAAMLDNLADTYKHEASHQDDHARTERERWGIDPARVAGATMTDTPTHQSPPRHVEQLILHGMTFASESVAPLGARLSLITGDNSTGKSVVLDALWWALTASWLHGRPVLPDRAVNGKAKIGLRFSDGVDHHARFDPKQEAWQRPEGWTPTDAVVVYARIDGGFSIFDPLRGVTIHLSTEEVFEGQQLDGAKSCNGLIADLPQWQSRLRRLHDAMNAVLAHLSPDGEPLALGDVVRVSIRDSRDFPTVKLPYGDVPVTQVSAAVRRILGLAYVLLWAWHEHQEAAHLTQEKTARSVVLLADEIESHLHPEWQRRILRGLLNAVEAVAPSASVQAVIVTHAPLVVASAEAVFDPTRDKLLHLALRDGRVFFEDLPFEKEGDASAWLTSPAFGLATSRSIEAERAVTRAIALLGTSPISPDVLRTQHSELVRVLAPTDPFFVRWVRHLRQHGIEP